MDMEDITNPVVLVVGGGLWFFICIMLWKIPNAWGLKEKILLTVIMLPLTLLITASVSNK